MQISVLRKLLQLIKNEIPEEEKSLEETLEQSPEKSDGNSEFEIRNSESEEAEIEGENEEMQNAECKMQNSNLTVGDGASTSRDDEDEQPTLTENNRSHLTSSVPRAAKAPTDALTKGELAEIRQLFNNLDDNEIQRLYKKVTKN